MDICYGNSKLIDVCAEPYAISFSFYSKKEIHDLSLVEVICPIFFDKKGVSILGGLCDLRMGVNSKKDVCISCNENYLSCPGHFGHIDLIVPIRNPMLKNLFFNMIKAKCNYCNQFRISNWRTKLFFFKFLHLDLILLFKKQLKKKFQIFKKFYGSKEKNFEKFFSYKLILIKKITNQIKKATQIQNFPKISKLENRKRGKFWAFSVNFFLKTSSNQKSCQKCKKNVPTLVLFQENLKILIKCYFEVKKKIRFYQKGKLNLEKNLLDFCEEKFFEIFSEKFFEKEIKGFQLKKNIDDLWKYEKDFCELIWGSLGNSERFKKENNSEIFFISSLLVPPTRFRPVYISKIGKKKNQTKTNPQNFYFLKILKINQQLLMAIGSRKKEEGKKWSKIFYQYEKTIASMFDNSIYPSEKQSLLPSGIKQQLEKKFGIFRMYIMGKRVGHSARTIITPDPFLLSFEVGIPRNFALHLTSFPPINFLNFPKKKNKRENFQIESLFGKKFSLKPSEKFPNFFKLFKICKKYKKCFFQKNCKKYGINRMKTIISEKNFVLLNRQPSLHRASLMSHSVKIIPQNKCIKIHYSNCNSYNADFDGDEMNLHFPQNDLARSESLVLSSAFHHSKIPTQKSIVRGLIQDNIIGSVFLTRKDTFFSQNLLFQILCFLEKPKKSFENLFFPSILKPKVLWTGKQLVFIFSSLFFKKNWQISLESRSKLTKLFYGLDETKILIRKGELLRGILDSSQIGKNKHGLLHAFNEIYGNYMSDLFLSYFGKISIFFQRHNGFSVGIEELVLKKKIDWKRLNTFRKEKLLFKVYLKKNLSNNGLFLNFHKKKKLKFKLQFKILAFFCTLNSLFESFVRNLRIILGVVSSNILENLIIGGLQKKPQINGFSQMTNSGAKGTSLNIYQICCSLGQTELEGEFFHFGPGGKSLPNFPPFDLSARANGFIFQRFLTGIPQPEYFFHCMAGREGLLDTSIKTSQSGYVQRSLVKHLESLKVAYDGTVRFSNGSISQLHYSKNGTYSCGFDFEYFLPWFFQNFQKQINFNSRKCEYIVRSRVKKIQKTQKIFMKKFFTIDNRFLNIKNLLEFRKIVDRFIRLKRITLSEKLFLSEEEKLLKLLSSNFVESGDPVGIIASQSIGEPCTQMTLNTFHFAGKMVSKNNLGIPRLREILLIASKFPKNPTMSVYFKKNLTPSIYSFIEKRLKPIFFFDLIETIYSFVEKINNGNLITYRIRLANKKLYKHQLGFKLAFLLRKIKNYFKKIYLFFFKNKYISLDKDSPNAHFFEKLENLYYLWKKKDFKKIKTKFFRIKNIENVKRLFEYRIKKKKEKIFELFKEKMIGFNYCLRNIPMIKNGFIDYKKKIIHTDGVNFFFFWKNGDLVDLRKIFTNDIYAIMNRYGIEAARETLVRELNTIFQVQSILINFHHFDVISDYITRLGNFRPFSRKGIYEESPLQKITYETALEFLVNFSLNKQRDFLESCSSSLSLGKICKIGTGSFEIISRR